MSFTADQAARLVGQATRLRTDGSRGVRARRAWRRLVMACGEGDPAVQDAVRDTAHDLPEADVLDLLAAAPEEPADKAAYLALIGQDAQWQALDPDGSLLALAYRAATPEARERLRTAMSTTGDTDAIRVVVTGDQRDRIAEMTYEELDYLGHHLAEHRQWDELRRLARDLPLVKATAAARLLPDGERTTPLVHTPEELRTTIERLPRTHLITHEVGETGILAASFSPDSSELALSYDTPSQNLVESLRMATGEVDRHFSKSNRGEEKGFRRSVLHLGAEILDLHRWKHGYRVLRVMPEIVTVCAGSGFAGGGFGALRRSSQGAVSVGRAGLKFIDYGAVAPRFQEVPRFGGKNTEPWLYVRGLLDAVATLPASRLIAFILDDLFVLDERGNVLHEIPDFRMGNHARDKLTLTFLSPHSLAIHGFAHAPNGETIEVWDLTPGRPPRPAGRPLGAIQKSRLAEKWRGLPLDPAFAARVTAPVALRGFLAAAPGADISATAADGGTVEVDSPHLPTARALLELPLLRSNPKDLRHAMELRAKIGDPAVREALDLLAACLADRFGDEIALGTGQVGAGGVTDIALSQDQNGDA